MTRHSASSPPKMLASNKSTIGSDSDCDYNFNDLVKKSTKEDNLEKYYKKASQISLFALIITTVCAVLIWDIKRVSIMSEVMHDDHKSK